MPREFESCVKSGGRVRTLRVGKDKYKHICYRDDGKSFAGHTKKKKK